MSFILPIGASGGTKVRYVDVGGARMSAIGLGTWQFYAPEWGYGRSYANEVAHPLVDRALELGITLFDTAEVYGLGRSERILGEALEGRRDDAFIATKILPVAPLAPIVEQRARASLKRLRTDRIDLYQMHWPNPVVGDGPAMTGMRRLIDAGVVKHAGVSNYNLARWQGAEVALGSPVLSNQVRFNLVDRRPLDEMVAWAQASGRLVIAYSPLAQGLLGGRYDASNRPSGAIRRANPLFLPENLERAEPLIGALRGIAATHQAKPAQIALAWLIRKPNVVAIPGASSVEQLESNAAAAEIDLSDAEDAQLLAAAEAFEPVGAAQRARGVAESLVGSVRDRLGLGTRA
jgi:aryl-alcohol dehydrogenase-like predicted oxidoreductase